MVVLFNKALAALTGWITKSAAHGALHTLSGAAAKAVTSPIKDISGTARDVTGMAKDVTGIQRDSVEIKIAEYRLEEFKSRIILPSSGETDQILQQQMMHTAETKSSKALYSIVQKNLTIILAVVFLGSVACYHGDVVRAELAMTCVCALVLIFAINKLAGEDINSALNN